VLIFYSKQHTIFYQGNQLAGKDPDKDKKKTYKKPSHFKRILSRVIFLLPKICPVNPKQPAEYNCQFISGDRNRIRVNPARDEAIEFFGRLFLQNATLYSFR